MIEHESMIGRRLIAWMIDALIFILLGFFCFGFCIHPIYSNNPAYQNDIACYEEYDKQYAAIQDEYGIFYYDANNNRLENDQATEEMKNNFLNDERVIELKEKIIPVQASIFRHMALELFFTLVITGAITELILPLCIRKGRTIGKCIMKLYIVNGKLEYISWYMLILRQTVYIITNVLLGVFTIGIVPLLNLLVAILTRGNQTLYDLASRSYVIDGKIPVEVNVKYQKENNHKD